jgi:hypothetical protein
VYDWRACNRGMQWRFDRPYWGVETRQEVEIDGRSAGKLRIANLKGDLDRAESAQ